MALVYLACIQITFCFSHFALSSKFLKFFVLLFLVTIGMGSKSFNAVEERSGYTGQLSRA